MPAPAKPARAPKAGLMLKISGDKHNGFKAFSQDGNQN